MSQNIQDKIQELKDLYMLLVDKDPQTNNDYKQKMEILKQIKHLEAQDKTYSV